MEFFIQYNIPNKGFWTPKFINKVESADEIINKWYSYKKTIELAFKQNSNRPFFKGFIKLQRLIYLTEILIGEGKLDSIMDLNELEKCLNNPNAYKSNRESTNLNKTIVLFLKTKLKLFDNLPQLPIATFTSEFICKIHKKVAVKIMTKAGSFRKIHCAPAHENWQYLEPENIAKHLDKLCENVRNEIIKQQSTQLSHKTRLRDRIKITATFLVNFLQIHPFTDGNGRVGRILLSWLLSDIFVFPVPLFTHLSSRKIYLDCLRKTRTSIPYIPKDLARLILESAAYSYLQVINYLDLNN